MCGFSDFSPSRGLTNCASYDTLAKLTTPGALYEIKTPHKMLQRHSTAPTEILRSIYNRKNSFIFIIILRTYFLISFVSTDTQSLEFQCLTTPDTMKELVII
jgi:hypothetical protein